MLMNPTRASFSVIIFAIVLLVPQVVNAGIYLRIEEKGSFSLTNSPSDDSFRLITGKTSEQRTERLDRAVDIASGKYRMPKSLILSIIRNKGNQVGGGVMGLPPVLTKDMADTEVRSVILNVSAGTKFLQEMIAKFDGNLVLALGAYRVGPDMIESSGGLPNREVREFVNNVRRSFDTFESREEIIYTYRNDDGVLTIVNIRSTR